MIKKRKKHIKFRGHSSHGWGSRKKHRGAGNKGGRGMAGSGKRADQKKPSILKKYGSSYFGKRGFNRPKEVTRKNKTMNVGELEKFNEETIDLTKLGYDKLLGKGKIKKKLNVIVNFASKKSIKKIEDAGGKVKVNSLVKEE